MRYAVPPYVQFREVGDEVVILDTSSDVYVGLNRSAALIWFAFAEGRPVDDVVDELVTGFVVARGAAYADVVELGNELVRRGLVESVAD